MIRYPPVPEPFNDLAPNDSSRIATAGNGVQSRPAPSGAAPAKLYHGHKTDK